MEPGSCGGVVVKIDVRGLIGQPGKQREMDLIVPVMPLQSVEGDVRFESARVKLLLTSVPDGIVATASVDSQADVYCSRCLTSFSEPVHGEIDHLFVTGTVSVQDSPPRGFQSRGKLPPELEDETDKADEGPDVSPVTDGQIDIALQVSEALSLGIPMKALCRPDCKGLCPVCGCNLNETKCLCTGEAIDPRLAGLGSLLAPAPEATADEPVGKPKEKDQRGRSKT